MFSLQNSGNPEMPPLVKAIVLQIFTVMLLTVLRPSAKRAYGANWIFVTPGVLFSLEAGQSALFLQYPPSDPGFVAALLFQLAYSFFKYTGMQKDLIEKFKTCVGMPTDPEKLAESRTDLCVIATAHNFSEIAAIVFLFILLFAEKLCYAVGLSASGSLADVMDNRYRTTGMLSGWRLDVKTGESIPFEQSVLALLIVLLGRVGVTLLEEKFGSKRFGPRRKTVKRLLDLIMRDGPRNFRMMCYAMVVAQLFIVPSEMAYYGRWMYENACGEASAECKLAT